MLDAWHAADIDVFQLAFETRPCMNGIVLIVGKVEIDDAFDVRTHRARQSGIECHDIVYLYAVLREVVGHIRRGVSAQRVPHDDNGIGNLSALAAPYDVFCNRAPVGVVKVDRIDATCAKALRHPVDAA